MTIEIWPGFEAILIALERGEFEDALAGFKCELAASLDDRRRHALLVTRGRLRVALGDSAGALSDLNAALLLATDPAAQGATLLARAETFNEAGRVGEARADLDRALPLLRARGAGEADALRLLGRLERDHGDPARAAALLTRACGLAADDRILLAETALDLAIALRSGDEAERALRLLERLLTRDIGDLTWRGRVLTQIGVTQGVLGAWPRALDTFEAALCATLDGNDRARLRYNRAAAWRALGDVAAAMDELARAIDEAPDDPAMVFDIRLLEGVLARKREELERSVEALRRAIDAAPDDERQGKARLELGTTLAATGLFGVAVDEFSAALALCHDPADLASAHRYRGIARHNLGLAGLALDDVTRAVALTCDPDERARGELTRAALLTALDDRDGAFAALERAVNDARDPAVVAQARFQRGSLAAGRGAVELGLSDLEHAIAAAHVLGDVTFEAQARLNQGVALDAIGRQNEAEDAFSLAAELAARGPLAHLAWLNLARLRAAGDQQQAAVAAFERAAVVAEDDRQARADAFLARGNALIRWGRYVEADADFTRVLALQPGDALQAQARYSRGLTRGVLGQLERARDDLSATIAGARDRDHRAQALLDRGLVAFAAGDFAGALDDVRAASDLFRRRSRRAVALTHLAVIHAQQGHCAAAAEELRRAFALDRAGDALRFARLEPGLRRCADEPGFPPEAVADD